MNREYLSKFLPWVQFNKSIENSIEFIIKEEEKYMNKSITLGIFFEDYIIGSISLNKLDIESKTSHIGYWITEKMGSKGITTLCCKTLIDACSQILGIEKFYISCDLKNIPSQRIAQKLLFTQISSDSEENNLYELCLYNKEVIDSVELPFKISSSSEQIDGGQLGYGNIMGNVLDEEDVENGSNVKIDDV